MSTIKETVLKLPHEEKVDLLYALQEDLHWNENVFEEDGLSPEDLAELKKRETMIESGEAGFITLDEFKKKLNELKG